MHGTDRCGGELENELENVLFVLYSRVDVTDNCVFPIIREPI